MSSHFDHEKYVNNWPKKKKNFTNYYIGSDNKIVFGISENRRAWTSANRKNDNVVITIEVGNYSAKPD